MDVSLEKSHILLNQPIRYKRWIEERKSGRNGKINNILSLRATELLIIDAQVKRN